MPACKDKDLLSHVKNAVSPTGVTKLNPGKNSKKLAKELLQFEAYQVSLMLLLLAVLMLLLLP